MLERLLIALTASVALLFATGLGVAAETTSNGGKIAGEDATFIKEAAAGGMAEVQLGKLAAEKGIERAGQGVWSANAEGS